MRMKKRCVIHTSEHHSAGTTPSDRVNTITLTETMRSYKSLHFISIPSYRTPVAYRKQFKNSSSYEYQCL